MAKPISELTRECLRPLVEQGLNAKKIVHELQTRGVQVELRTVQRRLKALGLKRTKVQLEARTPILTGLQKSPDPILSKRLELDHDQLSAARIIRTACSENVGVKGQDLFQMMMRSASPSTGMTENERARDANRKMKVWITQLRRMIDPSTNEPYDHRPAVLICGHAITVKQTGAHLGMSERRASKLCKRTLDIFAEVVFPKRRERRRHAFVAERATVQESYS